MPNRDIVVTVTGSEVETLVVRAEPNPLPRRGAPEIRPGDSVTWEFRGLRDGLIPLILFQEVRTFHGSRIRPAPGDKIDPLGPFKTLSLSRDRVVASEAYDQEGRFIYKIAVIDSQPGLQDPEIQFLRWVPGLEGENFGGIDKPKTPEGGG